MIIKSVKKEGTKLSFKATVNGDEWTSRFADIENLTDEHLYAAGEDVINETKEKALCRKVKEVEMYTVLATESFQPEVCTKEEFSFVITFTTYPDVKFGDYSNVKYIIEETEVTEAELEAKIAEILSQSRAYEDKSDGLVEVGDTAKIDFEGFLDGVPFEGGKAENFDLVIGSGAFIPGFEPQLVGMKCGEEKDINVTFPEMYDAELAGKDAVFRVKVNAILREKDAELNEEFVEATRIPGVTTVDEFKQYLKDMMGAEKSGKAAMQAETDFVMGIVDTCETDIPEAIIEGYVDSALDQLKAQLTQQRMTLESYLEMTNMTEDKLKEELRSGMEVKAKTAIVLEALALRYNIEVTDEEKQLAYQALAQQYRVPLERVTALDEDGRVSYDIRIRKAVDTVKKENM